MAPWDQLHEWAGRKQKDKVGAAVMRRQDRPATEHA